MAEVQTHCRETKKKVVKLSNGIRVTINLLLRIVFVPIKYICSSKQTMIQEENDYSNSKAKLNFIPCFDKTKIYQKAITSETS